jgi:hypothetical protein
MGNRLKTAYVAVVEALRKLLGHADDKPTGTGAIG